MRICGDRRGTNAGYQRHARAGEDPCGECREGRNAARRARWVPAPPRPDSLPERFWAKVDRGGADDCWPWIGHTTREGYGRIQVGGRAGRMQEAHRVSWLLEHGTLPERELDHTCHTDALQEGRCVGGACAHRRCVNPRHLEDVTPRVNSSRSDAGRINGDRQRAITHCPQGHPYDEENTHVKRSGARRCRACARAYYHKTKELKR